jgi:hypothetical protein
MKFPPGVRLSGASRASRLDGGADPLEDRIVKPVMIFDCDLVLTVVALEQHGELDPPSWKPFS